MIFNQTNLNSGDVNNATEPSREGRLRIMTISSVMLAELLKLPEGTRIEGYSIERSFGYHLPDLQLKVSHPDFSPVELAQKIPHVGPMYQRAVSDRPVLEFLHW